MEKNILYIHGMGGGGDSRIPRLLRSSLAERGICVICRTYDFDPETGYSQIQGWVEELAPVLVIGESLGAIQALRVKKIPHLFVSPALGGPDRLYHFAWLTLLPGGSWALHRKFRVKEGDRQRLVFRFRVLRRYRAHWEAAAASVEPDGFYYAFFGRYDHYKRSGVVNVDTWRKMFGNSFQEYDGTHFMEEEYVDSMLIPKILSLVDPA